MGRGCGGGGLRILPTKSWNVWNFDNRKKVKADEEKYAALVAERQAEQDKIDAEFRRQVLRKRSRSKLLSAADGTDGPSGSASGDALLLPVPDEPAEPPRIARPKKGELLPGMIPGVTGKDGAKKSKKDKLEDVMKAANPNSHFEDRKAMKGRWEDEIMAKGNPLLAKKRQRMDAVPRSEKFALPSLGGEDGQQPGHINLFQDLEAKHEEERRDTQDKLQAQEKQKQEIIDLQKLMPHSFFGGAVVDKRTGKHVAPPAPWYANDKTKNEQEARAAQLKQQLTRTLFNRTSSATKDPHEEVQRLLARKQSKQEALPPPPAVAAGLLPPPRGFVLGANGQMRKTLWDVGPAGPAEHVPTGTVAQLTNHSSSSSSSSSKTSPNAVAKVQQQTEKDGSDSSSESSDSEHSQDSRQGKKEKKKSKKKHQKKKSKKKKREKKEGSSVGLYMEQLRAARLARENAERARASQLTGRS
eukprot:g10227.t1